MTELGSKGEASTFLEQVSRLGGETDREGGIGANGDGRGGESKSLMKDDGGISYFL